MRLEVFCGNRNCGEYILDTDTDVLASPLKGHMFKPRPDREWQHSFDEESEGMNLTCPMCEWAFHVEQVLIVRKPTEDAKITGKVWRILKHFVPPPPKPPTIPKKQPAKSKRKPRTTKGRKR